MIQSQSQVWHVQSLCTNVIIEYSIVWHSSNLLVCEHLLKTNVKKRNGFKGFREGWDPFMCDQHGTITGHLPVDSPGPIAHVAFPWTPHPIVVLLPYSLPMGTKFHEFQNNSILMNCITFYDV